MQDGSLALLYQLWQIPSERLVIAIGQIPPLPMNQSDHRGGFWMRNAD
jgi:hypothetical protein